MRCTTRCRREKKEKREGERFDCFDVMSGRLDNNVIISAESGSAAQLAGKGSRRAKEEELASTREKSTKVVKRTAR